MFWWQQWDIAQVDGSCFPGGKKDKKKQQLRLFQNIIKAIYSKTTMFGEKTKSI